MDHNHRTLKLYWALTDSSLRFKYNSECFLLAFWWLKDTYGSYYRTAFFVTMIKKRKGNYCLPSDKWSHVTGIVSIWESFTMMSSKGIIVTHIYNLKRLGIPEYNPHKTMCLFYLDNLIIGLSEKVQCSDEYRCRNRRRNSKSMSVKLAHHVKWFAVFLFSAAPWVWLKRLWRPSMDSTCLETRYLKRRVFDSLLTVSLGTRWHYRWTVYSLKVLCEKC